MPLVNLLNRIDVTAVIHQDSLVFFLDRVFQAIERQPAEKVQMKSLTTLTTSSSQLPHKTEMTVLLLLFIKLSMYSYPTLYFSKTYRSNFLINLKAR